MKEWYLSVDSIAHRYHASIPEREYEFPQEQYVIVKYGSVSELYDIVDDIRAKIGREKPIYILPYRMLVAY